jgi:putative ABC transport system permease protein
LAVHVPFDYGLQIADVGTLGEIPGREDEYVSMAFNVVGHDYFETTGVSVLRGRGLERSDDGDSQRVAVVNETMARQLWPSQDAVGQRFRFERDGEWVSVVGVAADGKYMMMAEEPRGYFYLPLEQHYRSPLTLMVRTAGSPETMVAPLQELMRGLDPALPVYNVRTMDSHIRESVFGLMPLRSGARMAAVQGVIGLLMAILGLYAVVSFSVNQRTHEIGVRMAMGARQVDVMRLVIREGLGLTVKGVLVGLVVAVALGFGLSRILYGLAAVDVPVVLTVTGLLVAVSALACYIPALRATRVDPMTALRNL